MHTDAGDQQDDADFWSRVDLTNPQIRDKILASLVDHELEKLGVRDGSVLISELTRLQYRYATARQIRDRQSEPPDLRPRLESRNALLTQYMGDLRDKLMEQVEGIVPPTTGIPGGWFLDVPGSEQPPTCAVFPPGLVPRPAVAVADSFPIWRTHLGAQAALTSLREAGWPGSAGLEVQWTPLAATEEEEPGVEIVDDRYWQSIGNPVVQGRNYFRQHRDDRDTLAVIAIPPAEVRTHARLFRDLLLDQFQLGPIPGDLLHVSLWTAYGRTAPPVTEEFVRALRHAVPESAIEAQVGPAVVSQDGLALDITCAALPHLVDLIENVAQQYGAGSRPAARPLATLQLAYSGGALPMDFTGINELRLRTAWRVDELLVVRTTIRPDAPGYTWELVDSVRLAAPR